MIRESLRCGSVKHADLGIGRIMQTLLPFYAFDHAELEKRNGEAEKTVETFTMIVKKGKVEIQASPARGIQCPVDS
jgi:hypothetical protein